MRISSITFGLAALLCTTVLMTSCSNDNNVPVTPEPPAPPTSPLVGTYSFAEYTLDSTSVYNAPAAGALYMDWHYTETNALPVSISNFFRFVGGLIIPQTLTSITLAENGDVQAHFIPDAEIKGMPAINMMTGLNIIQGKYKFPTAEEVTANFATEQGTLSPAGVAAWSADEEMSTLLVRLNVGALMGAGGLDLSAIAGMDPSVIKGILGGLLVTMKPNISSADSTYVQDNVKKISDETIKQALGWVVNGIPFQITQTEDGHTLFYLNKEFFMPLFTAHDGSSDIEILWAVLSKLEIIPKDMSPASLILTQMKSNWDKTEAFNIGFDLVKK
jgi:hypothetical protein